MTLDPLHHKLACILTIIVDECPSDYPRISRQEIEEARDALAAYDAARSDIPHTICSFKCQCGVEYKFMSDNSFLITGIKIDAGKEDAAYLSAIRTVNHLKTQVDMWIGHYRMANEEYVELRSRLHSESQRRGNAEAECAKLRETVAELSSSDDDLDDADVEVDALKAECAKLRSERDDYHRKACEIADQRDDAQMECAKLRERLEETHRHDEGMVKTCEGQTKWITELKAECEALRNATISPAEVMGLRSMLSAEKAECAKLREQLENEKRICDLNLAAAERCAIERDRAEARLEALTSEPVCEVVFDRLREGVEIYTVREALCLARAEVCK